MQQEEHSDLARVECLEGLFDRDEIFEGFRHFLALDVQVTNMPEIIDPVVAAVECLRLRDLIVVVREAQVDTTSVDIDWRLLECLVAHSTALNVPAWTSLAPGRWPHGLTWL